MGWKTNLAVGGGFVAALAFAIYFFRNQIQQGAINLGSTIGAAPANVLGSAASSFVSTLQSYLPGASTSNMSPTTSPGTNPTTPGVHRVIGLTDAITVSASGGANKQTTPPTTPPPAPTTIPGNPTVPNPLTQPTDLLSQITSALQKAVAVITTVPSGITPEIPVAAGQVSSGVQISAATLAKSNALRAQQGLAPLQNAVSVTVVPGTQSLPVKVVTSNPIHSSVSVPAVQASHLSGQSLAILQNGFGETS